MVLCPFTSSQFFRPPSFTPIHKQIFPQMFFIGDKSDDIQQNKCGDLFDHSPLSRSVCLRFFVLWQTDGQIELCFFLGGGLKWKRERQMSRTKWGEKREEREEKGICWVSDNLRIRLWRRNQAASQPLPTSAWHGAAQSFPWKLWPPPTPVVCGHFAAE